MPQQFSIRIELDQTQDRPVDGVVLRAYDRDLPSLGRLGIPSEELLGEARSPNAEGAYDILYSADQFTRAEKGTADLVLRVFDTAGTQLPVASMQLDGRDVDPARPVYNAPAACVIRLRLEAVTAAAPSEYERVLADVAPVVLSVSLAELTREDMEFLAGETGQEARLLECLRGAAELARSTSVFADALYAWAREPLPAEWQRLLDVPDGPERTRVLDAILAGLVAAPDQDLRATLLRMVDAHIVADSVRDRADEAIRRLKRTAEEPVSVTLRLLDATTGLPLAGHGVSVRADSIDGPIRATTVADALGQLSFMVWYPRGAAERPPQDVFVQLTANGNGPVVDPIRVSVDPKMASVDVRIPGLAPAVPTLATLSQSSQLGISADVIQGLAASGITTFADIRRRGGLDAAGAPGLDAAMAHRLASLADLDRLTPHVESSTALVTRGYTSVLQIASTPREVFVDDVKDTQATLSEAHALDLHVAAEAQVAMLNHVVVANAVDVANGYTLLSAPAIPAVAIPNSSTPGASLFTQACECADCESAVSPAAYLADLLDYALKHVRDDTAPIDLTFLTELLHQPLGDLPTSCGAVQDSVRQVRLAVEVLRNYLGPGPLSDPARQAPLAAAEKAYRVAAYEQILRHLGTTSLEIRRGHAATNADRSSLASRLGIGLTTTRPGAPAPIEDELDRLFRDPDAPAGDPHEVREDVLEQLFGLVDTTRDPLSGGTMLVDAKQQIRRWNIDGIRWGANVDGDGRMFGRLQQTPAGAYRLDLYREPARLDPVASGQITTPQGVCRLVGTSASGLSGTVQIAYAADDDTLVFAAMPALLAWRVRNLRTIWASQDRPTDALTEGESTAGLQKLPADLAFPAGIADRIAYDAARGNLVFKGAMQPTERDALLGLAADPDYQSVIASLYRDSQRPPIIDPDVIGPDDFRTPDVADAAFALWSQRRTLVDQWLSDLQTGRHTQGLDAVLVQELGKPVPALLQLANSLVAAATPDDARTVRATIEDLGISAEGLGRLLELRAASGEGVASESDLRDADSLLAQARKVAHFAAWRAEERAANVSLGPLAFWSSLREPRTGVWPPLDSPLLDPDTTRPGDVSEAFGDQALALLQARQTRLHAITNELRSTREAQGFDAMLRAAIVNPAPDDPLAFNPTALLQELDGPDDVAAKNAEARFHTELDITVAQFRWLMAIRARAGLDVARQPTPDDWAQTYALLTGSRKRLHEYPSWRLEEAAQGMVYWKALKASLPQWRSSDAARQDWRLALRTRSRSPIVDPEVIGPQALRTLQPNDPAFQIWTARHTEFEGWRTSLRSAQGGAPTPEEGWRRAIQDGAGLGVPAGDLEVLAADAKHGRDITSRLDQLGLSFGGFAYLLRIGELVKGGQLVSQSEWDILHATLLRARKLRQFGLWRDEEAARGLLLAPEFFVVPPSQAVEAGAMPPSWLALTSAQLDWADALQSRLDLERTTIDAVRSAIDAVEEATLPPLRDALVAACNDDNDSYADVARRLTRELFIDTQVDGCRLTTRVEQAIETIQGMLFAVRTGQLADAGPQTLASLSVSNWGDRRTDIFARSTDNRLWHRVRDGRWRPWREMSPPPPQAVTGLDPARPSVVAPATGRLELFIRGDDSALWHRSYDARWSDWEPLNGDQITGEPGPAVRPDGTLDVFALRRSSLQTLQRTFATSWSAWQPIAAPSQRAPAAAAPAANRIDVILAAAAPTIFQPRHVWWDGATWHDDLLDDRLGSDPALVAWAPGRLDLLQNHATRLWHKVWDGAWHAWEDADADPASAALPPLSGAPAACAPGPGRLDAFGIRGGKLWERSFDVAAGWAAWQRLPGPDLKLVAADFDAEWAWMGSYTAWRSAMFGYIYVDNLLHPALHRHPSPAMSRLISSARAAGHIDPDTACQLATAFGGYFNDVCSLKVQATCIAETTVNTGVACGSPVSSLETRVYLFGLATIGKIYWSAIDPNDRADGSQTYWDEVPLAEPSSTLPAPKVHSIIGAIPCKANDAGQRLVYLFYDTQEPSGRVLRYSTFDLDRFGLDAPWTGGSRVLDGLPSETSAFAILPIQTDDEVYRPRLALHWIQSISRDVYVRAIDVNTGGWESSRPKWDDYIVSPRYADTTGIHPERVNRLEAVLQVGNVDWLVYVGWRGRAAWPSVGDGIDLNDGSGEVYGALPARGGPANNSTIFVFYNDAGERVYRQCGNITGPGPVYFTLPDLAFIARDSGWHFDERVLVYESWQSSDLQADYAFRYHEQGDQLVGSSKVRVEPRLVSPRSIPITTQGVDLEQRRTSIQAAYSMNQKVPKTIRNYLEEAYNRVPLFLALGLQAAGFYGEALDVFRTIYDYQAALAQRKIDYSLELDAAITPSQLYQHADNWLADPLDPYSIAETRRFARTRYLLLCLVECLHDFADAEFTRETGESLVRAQILYSSALDILGLAELDQTLGACDAIAGELEVAPGESVPPYAPAALAEIVDQLTRGKVWQSDGGSALGKKISQTLKSGVGWQTMYKQVSELAQEALSKVQVDPTLGHTVQAKSSGLAKAHATLLKNAELEQSVKLVGVGAAPGAGNGAVVIPAALSGTTLSAKLTPPVSPPSYLFCIPPNPRTRMLRQHAELNLHKLRTCRNIAGMRRDLDLYAAPTDATSGMPFVGAGGQIVRPGLTTIRPTLYRSSVLMERTRQLIQTASQMEALLLAALEKRDAAAFTLLEARHGLALKEAGVRLQRLRVTEATDQVTLASLQKARATIQANTYQSWLDQGYNSYEQQMLGFYQDVAQAQADAATAEYTTQVAQALEGVAMAGTGKEGAAMAGAAAVGFTALGRADATRKAAFAAADAQAAAFRAAYERRRDEWLLQSAIANQDMAIGDEQVTFANDRVTVVQQEQQIAELSASQAKDTLEFLNNKFSSVELYDWMSTAYEGVARYFLQQGTAMAKLTQSQIAFERQETPPNFIQDDYWAPEQDAAKAPDRKGLTGSARLAEDVQQLDQYAFETRKRKLQLTKTISLAQLAPLDFQRFRETGLMTFQTPMELFDRDFPGHHLRLIQRVRTSVIALIPPTQGVHATLTSGGVSRVVVGPEVFQRVTIRREPESIAITSPLGASGPPELETPPGDMLLPFEGNGVEMTWELRMPKAANAFDYRSLADVLFTMDYSALENADYRQQVIQSLPPTLRADRSFSFRNVFADAWYDLHNPELLAPAQRMLVRVRTTREDFPPNLDRVKIEQVLLYFVRADGMLDEIAVASLRFADAADQGQAGGAATSIDGIISTRRGNGAAWLGILGKSPAGQWELAMPTDLQTIRWFKDERIEDILLVVSYSGHLPDWPA